MIFGSASPARFEDGRTQASATLYNRYLDVFRQGANGFDGDHDKFVTDYLAALTSFPKVPADGPTAASSVVAKISATRAPGIFGESFDALMREHAAIVLTRLHNLTSPKAS
ncbi:hypothetical protein [Leifsonia sp. Leaf264]|uniref:hypothetical protein n=1 Tax=Leifsonia sp. Leaf264 TaxID=1736314 RepID=UPI0006F88925|nr:hypothetical protein [Leifsonia sp. Leaf264]KQO98462.1 hypothetical protein ASF30_10395 [Leifsonia sp. Leaf264]